MPSEALPVSDGILLKLDSLLLLLCKAIENKILIFRKDG